MPMEVEHLPATLWGEKIRCKLASVMNECRLKSDEIAENARDAGAGKSIC